VITHENDGILNKKHERYGNTATPSHLSHQVLTDLLYLLYVCDLNLEFQFPRTKKPGLLPTLREKLRTSYFLAMKVFLLLVLLFVAMMNMSVATTDDSPTRLIEAEEKAAVFIVKYGARRINKVMQDVGFSAEESKDRRFQSKVNRRVEILKHELTLGTPSSAVLPTADVPTALGWVVTKLYKVKNVKPFMTENLIKYVDEKTSGRISLSKKAIREHQKASIRKAILAHKAADHKAALLAKVSDHKAALLAKVADHKAALLATPSSSKLPTATKNEAMEWATSQLVLEEGPIDGYIYDNVIETVHELSSGVFLLTRTQIESNLERSQRNRILRTTSLNDATPPVTPALYVNAIPTGIRNFDANLHGSLKRARATVDINDPNETPSCPSKRRFLSPPSVMNHTFRDGYNPNNFPIESHLKKSPLLEQVSRRLDASSSFETLTKPNAPDTNKCVGSIAGNSAAMRKFVCKSIMEEIDDSDGNDFMTRLLDNCSSSLALGKNHRGGLNICVEIDPKNREPTYTLRSDTCTFVARENSMNQKTTRCETCHKKQKEAKKMLKSYEPQPLDAKKLPKTKVGLIAASPRKARYVIRALRKENMQLKRANDRNVEAFAKYRLKTKGILVKNKKQMKAMLETYRVADNEIGRRFEDDENDGLIRKLWKANFSMMEKFGKNGFKKCPGFKFDPLVLSWAVALASKTSRTTYDMITKVLCLPSIRRVSAYIYFRCFITRDHYSFSWPFSSFSFQILQIKAELAGKNKEMMDGICLKTIRSMKAVREKRGWKRGSNECLMSLSYDSTKLKDGVFYDVNNDFVGLDCTQSLDVLTSKFRRMVRTEQ
jgi:hypothetical protein